MSASDVMLGRLFAGADVRINGSRPWDPQILDRRFYRRVLTGGSLALGESYVDGWWEAEQLDELFCRVLRADLDRRFRAPWVPALQKVGARLFNGQTPTRSRESARRRYDVGNEFFESMLDERPVSSCGDWRDSATPAQAEETGLDLVCRKLGLRAGQSVLDIGCGWGSWARFAAQHYGVRVVGITLSREQVRRGRELCGNLPVELRLEDFRSLEGTFDHLVSIGMLEHVGARNYRHYMRLAHDRLSGDGLFVLHTIGGDESADGTDPWLHRYVFPNAMLPSARQLTEAVEGLFVIEDWQNFGADYDRTLMSWWANCEAHWARLGPACDERFRRQWKYYLLLCAGSFRARRNQVWQLVLSPRGVMGGYAASNASSASKARRSREGAGGRRPPAAA